MELQPLDYKSEEWYSEMIEELKGLKENFLDQRTEITMQAKWLIGQLIRSKNTPQGIQQGIANDLRISLRNVGYAMAFYDEFKAEDWDTAYGKIVNDLTKSGHKVSFTGWLKKKQIGAVSDCNHKVEKITRYRCTNCGKTFKEDPTK